MPEIIQGVNYKEVAVSLSNNSWDIVPFDFNGKPLTEMTIVVDTDLGNADINLPAISSFNGVYGTTIKIIVVNATNEAFINAVGSDSIGSFTTINLNHTNSSAFLIPALNNAWSVVLTA